jgi:group II intron reverse transcriptase/maturase
VNRLYDALTRGYHWVVDADIQDDFGSIDQTLLVDQIAERVSDGTVLRWIREMLRAGVLEEGRVRSTTRGTPQGGVASPLFGNIYLDALDHAMAAVPDVIYLRYADDWCALARTEEAARNALSVAREVVEDHLHLTLHPEKTRILDARTTAFDFLGFTFFWTDPGDTGRPLFGPKSAAIERLKTRVRELTRRNRPLNLEMAIADLAPVLRGWGRYFTISQKGDYYRLDAWIRERCRAFVAKRWNRSQQLDREWTNQRLADLGLPSLAAMRRQVLAQHPRP